MPNSLPDFRPTNEELTAIASLISDNQNTKGLENTYLNEQKLSEDQLLGLLDYHGVTMLADYFNNLPTALKPLITQRKAMMAANDELKKQQLIALFDAFAEANLHQSILFKGSALAYTLYAKPWHRPRSDSDILINPNQRKAFEDVFKQLGYKKQFAIEGNYVSYQHTFSKHLAGQSAINIDLHWRINNRQILAKSFNVSELIDHGQLLNELSPKIKTPSHVDSILISSLHRLGHHQHEERLTWLYDIHLLAASLSQAEWQHLLEKAQQKQLSGITIDALNLCKKVLDTVIPDEISQQMSHSATKPEASQLFLRRDLPERTLFWNDLKALPSITAKLSYLFETLVPNPEYIRQQMGTKYAAWGYLKRLVRGIKRVF